jgi:hypothetical protein
MPRPFVQPNTPRPFTSASDVIIANQQKEPTSKLRDVLSTVKDVAVGAGKEFIDTAQTVARPITNRLPEMVSVKTGQPLQMGFSEEELTPTNTPQKIGGVVEQVAEFFTPSSAGMKVAKVPGALNLAKRATTEALGAGAVGTVQEGTEGGLLAGGLGAVSPVLGKTVDFIAKGVTKNLAGAMAKGTNILDSVLDNPKAALEGMNLPAEEVFKKDIGLIKNAVTKSYSQAKDAFKTGLSELDKVIPSVDKMLAKPQIETVLDKYGVKLLGNKVDISESPLSDTEKVVVQKAIDILNSTKASTPTQIDALAQKIGKLERSGEDYAQINSIIRGIKNSLRKTIVDSAPDEVKDVAENLTINYAKSMDKLNLYEKLFKVSKDNFLSEIERANAMNKLKNLFSGSKPLEEQTLKEMGLGDIISRQAGRVTAGEDISRSQTGLGDILKTAVNVVFTPSTITRMAANLKMGTDEVSALVGKSGTVEEFINQLPKGVQGTAFQILRGLIED